MYVRTFNGWLRYMVPSSFKPSLPFVMLEIDVTESFTRTVIFLHYKPTFTIIIDAFKDFSKRLLICVRRILHTYNVDSVVLGICIFCSHFIPPIYLVSLHLISVSLSFSS